ncbi:Phosphorylated carbohydrates phosphatase [bioreactor metagenome]|uniref:Phosphorylated carbohydrates phosphatase n=1 Tax=bioreactor metagenome TaxID=1076179 RepID=A0A644ZJ19_9ZZZZ
MMNNIKAAIFDMDGTIVDSMWVWEQIDLEYLAKHNVEASPFLKHDIAHLSFDEVALYFKNAFKLPYDVEEIKNHWNQMAFDKYSNSVKLKPGIERFLKVLKTKGIKIALATSNNTLLLEACLKANGIYEYFDVITLTDEVSRGKDFPDVYLLTAERLQVKPEECVVFEYILPAVKGAKAAGMTVVGVYDEHSKDTHEDIKIHADRFINEYDEINNAV